jgi:hypothetical protein
MTGYQKVTFVDQYSRRLLLRASSISVKINVGWHNRKKIINIMST